VKASYAFVRAAFDHAAEHADELKKLTAEARKPRERIALRTRTVAEGKGATVLGYEETTKDGRRVRTDTPRDYPVKLVTKCEPTLEIDVPAAYLIPPGFPAAVETLRRHGIKLEELTGDVRAEAQSYRVTEIKKAGREFQKHALVTLEVKPAKDTHVLPAGSMLVPTAQPLGNVAAYLLEPQAEDGLAAWNFFDEGLEVGELFPVVRLPEVPAAAVQEKQKKETPRRYTLDSLLAEPKEGKRPPTGGSGRGRFGGAIDWLPDGEHFLQPRQGRLMRVHARTG
jgi:hypothetical protein